MTDDEILASLHAGDRTVFPLLYQRYSRRGVRYAYSLLKNLSDAEEAVQEVFCRLLAPLSRGEVDPSRGGFSAFFFKALRNLCIDMLRKSRGTKHLPIESASGVAAQPAVEASRQAGVVDTVRRSIEALPPNHGDALKLRLNGRLSYEQIAEILDCSRAQVRTWIYRARRQLEEDFQNEGLFGE
ncbi:MAG: RNA polymerase sigma factor [Planctomycetota bacterium]